MPDGLGPLAVWCFDRQAGALTQSANGMEFAYTADWVADQLPPLSQSAGRTQSISPNKTNPPK